MTTLDDYSGEHQALLIQTRDLRDVAHIVLHQGWQASVGASATAVMPCKLQNAAPARALAAACVYSSKPGL